MLNFLSNIFCSDIDKAFATAKAINRKCPPYMFKENWR